MIFVKHKKLSISANFLKILNILQKVVFKNAKKTIITYIFNKKKNSF